MSVLILILMAVAVAATVFPLSFLLTDTSNNSIKSLTTLSLSLGIMQVTQGVESTIRSSAQILDALLSSPFFTDDFMLHSANLSASPGILVSMMRGLRTFDYNSALVCQTPGVTALGPMGNYTNRTNIQAVYSNVTVGGPKVPVALISDQTTLPFVSIIMLSPDYMKSIGGFKLPSGVANSGDVALVNQLSKSPTVGPYFDISKLVTPDEIFWQMSYYRNFWANTSLAGKTAPDFTCSIGYRIDNSLTPHLNSVTLTNNSIIMLMSGDGRLISTNKAFTISANFTSVERLSPDLSPNPQVAALGKCLLAVYGSYGNITAVTNGTQVQVHAALLAEGQNWFVSASTIVVHGTDFIVAIGLPRSDMFQAMDLAERNAVIIGATVAVGGILLTATMTFLTLRPLQKMAKSMTELTKFDFSSLESGALNSRSTMSEIRAIESVFDVMVKAFAGAIRENRALNSGSAFAKSSQSGKTAYGRVNMTGNAYDGVPTEDSKATDVPARRRGPAVPITAVVVALLAVLVSSVTLPLGFIVYETSNTVTNSILEKLFEAILFQTATQMEGYYGQIAKELTAVTKSPAIADAFLHNSQDMSVPMSNVTTPLALALSRFPDLGGLTCVSYPNASGAIPTGGKLVQNFTVVAIASQPCSQFGIDAFPTCYFRAYVDFRHGLDVYGKILHPTDFTDIFYQIYFAGGVFQHWTATFSYIHNLNPSRKETNLAGHTNLNDVLIANKPSNGSIMFILDDLGFMWLSTNNDTLTFNTSERQTATENFNPAIATAGRFLTSQYGSMTSLPNSTDLQTIEVGSTAWVLTTRAVTMLPSPQVFQLVLLVPRNDYYGQMENASIKAVIIASALTILGVGVAVLYGYLSSRPLRVMQRHMVQLSKFDFSVLERDQLESTSYIRETRDVESTFLTMVKAFANAIKKNKELSTTTKGTSSSLRNNTQMNTVLRSTVMQPVKE
ncbi:hypothetical protein HK101_005629 [Irineochytrium annulatum]|nr:hypothetical protein HK101_005629 [Irineochytrium annulatum]